jgi:hypothetical protein
MIRLVRKPSIWGDFFQRLLFVVIFAGGLFTFTYLAWRHPIGMPRYAYAILYFFDLIAIGVLCDIAVRLWRTMNQGEPVVEIDRPLLHYGDTAQVRVIEPNPQLIAEMGVKLIGECRAKSVTDISQHHETRVARTRCYEEELLRLKPSSNEPVNRLLQLQLPKSAPADDIAWKIVVDWHLKQGGVIEHPFPLRVVENA